MALQGSNLMTFAYDDIGSLTEIIETTDAAMTTYVYDDENRLTPVEKWDTSGGGDQPPETSTYTYDGDGLRRPTHEPAASLTTFVWDGDDYLQERT